ncbi:G-protein coupled receptor dmsr-1-like [Lineus longissimus]|uniref:G-protein coupled receptor dmsr-1-like n=1 Tax=Lineus longissimus TaxID=88925 RepID=UPI002B4D411B
MTNWIPEQTVVTYDPMSPWLNSTELPFSIINASDPRNIQQQEGYRRYYYWGAENLEKFRLWYFNGHGYLASIICVLGIIANGVNIIVLTRKNMMSATNMILTAMAVADGLTMMAYLPFAILYYWASDDQSRGTAEFFLFYIYFSVLAHSISIWLTVTLAVFRYLFIRYPRRGVILCSIERAKLSVVLVFFANLFVCIPNFIGHHVKHHFDPERNVSTYQASTRDSPRVYAVISRINFWVISSLVKLLPCFLLIIASILLVRCMQEAEKRRKNLRKKSRPNCKDSDSRDRKTNRTTRMLLAVVVLFVICELPQGIVGIFVGILGAQFERDVYYPLGELFDIIALVNNGINFILYCTMSKQFRETFVLLFIKPLHVGHSRRGQFILVPNHNSNTQCTDV